MVVAFHVLVAVEGQPTVVLHNPKPGLCRSEKDSTYPMRFQRPQMALRLVQNCAFVSLIHMRWLLCL